MIPCSKPHDEEVFIEFKMPDGTYDDNAITTEAEKCQGDAFTQFVGIDSSSSSLEVVYLAPTKTTWDEMNDRLIQCIITDPAGQTTGSLKGAAR